MNVPDFEQRVATARAQLDQLQRNGAPQEETLAALSATLGSLHAAVTERQQEHNLLPHQNQSLIHTQALEVVANGIVITDLDGTIQWVNPAFTQLTGYSSAEVVGQNPRILKSDQQDPAFYKDLWQTITAGKVWHGRLINQRKDGTHYHDEMTITPALDKNGEIASFIAVKQDVTERVQAEAALQKWAQIFEHAEWGIVIGSPDGRMLGTMNPAFAEMHGWTMEELAGRPITDVFAPEYRDDVAGHIRAAHKQGRHTFESWHIRKDGTRFPVLVSATAVKDPQGNVLYRAVNVQDISSRVQTEIAIQQRNAQLSMINSLNHAANRGDSLPEIVDLLCQKVQSMFAAKNASVYLLSDDRQYLVLQNTPLPSGLTRRMERLTGIEIPTVKVDVTANKLYQQFLQAGQATIINDPDILQQMIAAHIENQFAPKLVPQIARLLNYNSVMCIPLMSDSEPIGLLDIARESPFDKTNLTQLMIAAEQLTAVIQRKRAEEALKRANRQNALILQTAGEGIFGLDTEGVTIFVNEAAAQMTGWAAAELIGERHHDFVHHSRADGAPYPANNCPVHATCQDGQARHISDEVFWRKDGSSFPVEYISQPITENDELLGAVVTFKDISERLRQDEYLQAQQRLATVGQLAAGIAHDFNNIMGVISLYADLAVGSIAQTSKPRKYLGIIYEQANRAADLIRQILDFSRQSVMERHPIDLLPFLKELLKLLERTMPENIRLKLDYGEGHFLIDADLTRLQQILMNLAVNARDAMPDGGQLRVTVNNYTLPSQAPPPLPDMPPGKWVRLSVADNGSGIPPQNLLHIFEPFFTTKESGKGTGLGLAQAYGIVKQHDGFIGVASAVGAGTTFTIYLPALDSLEKAAPAATAVPAMTGQGEMILVVEDEPSMRTAVCDILEMLNYRPLPAENGEAALALFGRHEREIALVLSDVMMPGISGLSLHQTLVKQKPSTKTILMTGYPLEKDAKSLLEKGIVAWLQKPLNMDRLARLIGQTLGRRLE